MKPSCSMRSVVAGLVALTLLSACSSSGGSATTSAPGNSAASSGATGKPIEIMQVQGFTSADPASGESGVRAAIKSINDSGGIGGRPIQLVTCFGSDVNATQACARKAVADPNIVAAVTNTAYFGGFDEIATQNGLPVLGDIAVTAADFSCTVCFIPGPGVLVTAGAAAILYDIAKSRNLALAYIDIPAGQGIGPLIEGAVLSKRGAKFAAKVAVPPTAADVAPAIASLPSDTGGLVLAASQNLSAKLVTQARKSGATYPIVSNTPTAGLASINKLIGKAGTNLYVASDFNLSGPGYEAYQAGMKSIGKQGQLEDNAQAIYGWLGVQFLKELGTKLGATLSRSTLLAAATAMTAFDTGGLTPPLDFAMKQTALGGTLPRIVNTSIVAYKYNPDSESFDSLNGGNFIDVLKPPGA